MSMKMSLRILPAVLAASLAFPAAVLAQTATSTPAPAAPTTVAPAAKPAQRAALKAGNDVSRSDRVEQRIKEMHSKLGITAAQEPQFNSFAQVMRDNASNMQAVFAGRVEAAKSMTAADNMLSYQKLAEQHAQDLQKLVPPFVVLYGSLSDAQKKIADDMFRNAGSPRSAARHS